MKYKLEVNELIESVLDTEADVIIPNDPNNEDWVAYEAWVAEGNTADLLLKTVPVTMEKRLLSLWQNGNSEIILLGCLN